MRVNKSLFIFVLVFMLVLVAVLLLMLMRGKAQTHFRCDIEILARSRRFVKELRRPGLHIFADADQQIRIADRFHIGGSRIV